MFYKAFTEAAVGNLLLVMLMFIIIGINGLALGLQFKEFLKKVKNDVQTYSLQI